MKLLIYIITCYGLCNIVVYSHIFKFWRNFWDKINPNGLGKLFHCMMCFGFWTGIFVSSLLFINHLNDFSPFQITYNYTFIINLLLNGCFTSGVIWLIHTIQETLERINPTDHG